MPDFSPIGIDLPRIGILVAISFLATLTSSMSGGGSSMIVTPVYLMLGYPLPVCIATNSVGGACWTLIASRNYLRGHEVDWKLIRGMVLCGLVGAFFGTRVILFCDPSRVRSVIGGCILAIVLYTVFKRNFGLEAKPPTASRFMTSLMAFPLGFYEAFFGSGNGFFTSAILTKTRGFILTEALGYYYFMSFSWCVFAAILYLVSGKWDLSLIVPSIAGAMCGASLGSRIGARKGSRFVKGLFVAIGSLLGAKLLFGF